MITIIMKHAFYYDRIKIRIQNLIKHFSVNNDNYFISDKESIFKIQNKKNVSIR